MKRREAKSKGEQERYTHLNGEFQRIARRDKKAFLGDQCKEIEENNRMGKMRDLFKKIRDTRSTTHHNQAELPESPLFKLCIGIQPSEEPRMGKDPLPQLPALGYTQQGKW